MVCSVPTGIVLGIFLWFTVRYVFNGFFTVDQNERAVKTRFGKATRIGEATTLDHPIAEALNKKDLERYIYPQVRVIPPGGPYYRWPWEKVYTVSVATETMSMALDLETPSANSNGTELEAVRISSISASQAKFVTGRLNQIFTRISLESKRLSFM